MSKIRWNVPLPRSLESFRTEDETLIKLRILLLGGCLVLTTAAALEAKGALYGFSIETFPAWPAHIDEIDTLSPDLVVFQPFIVHTIGHIWNEWPFLEEHERRQRVDELKGSLTIMINRLVSYSKGRCILVQGMSSPQHSPDGRSDFRLVFNFSQMIVEINEHLKCCLREHSNMFFVDEERVVSNAGKSNLMDDMVETYGHHGGLDTLDYDPMAGCMHTKTRAELYGIEPGRLSELLAREYLDCYSIFRGHLSIKCVIVDLDNTLWRGVVGEEVPIVGDHFPGIHQALRILRQRGIVLATCSRNNYDDVMSYWNGLAKGLLTPSDFVMHMINWRPKDENIRTISEVTGVALENILFVDDNPVERSQVRSSLPEVQVLDADIVRVREILMSDPRLQVNVRTKEGTKRTEMLQTQLQRDSTSKERTTRECVKSLRVQMSIRKIGDASSVPRIIELSQRTNQFNTTQVRYDATTIKEFLGDPNMRIYVCQVADRFGDYGQVGLCVLRDNCVDNLAISCRVLSLNIAKPFLVSVLKKEERPTWLARLIRTPRNVPCWSIFVECGFSVVHETEMLTATSESVGSVDEELYCVSVVGTNAVCTAPDRAAIEPHDEKAM
jgi:FkbH-like protein